MKYIAPCWNPRSIKCFALIKLTSDLGPEPTSAGRMSGRFSARNDLHAITAMIVRARNVLVNWGVAFIIAEFCALKSQHRKLLVVSKTRKFRADIECWLRPIAMFNSRRTRGPVAHRPAREDFRSRASRLGKV